MGLARQTMFKQANCYFIKFCPHVAIAAWLIYYNWPSCSLNNNKTVYSLINANLQASNPLPQKCGF